MALLLQDLFDLGFIQSSMNNVTKPYVIKAQNVADYLYTQSEKENWDDRDFPNVAPPFSSMWFEWRQPPISRSGKKIIEFPIQPREGIYIVSIDTQDEDQRIDLIRSCAETVMGRRIEREMWINRFGKTPECRWLCVAMPVSEHDKKIIAVGMGVYGVREDGSFQRYSEKTQYAILTRLPIQAYGDDGKEVGMRINVGLFIPFLTMSFMHCKNVKVEKSAPTALALDKKRVRSGKTPMIRYHTIQIDAMGRRTSYPAAEAGLQGDTALHICRGHFKHFGPKWGTKLLFGKYEGQYWWPMLTRGNPDRGVIVSEYEVNAK